MARVSDLLKIQRARKMTPRERFLAGAELFEDVCERSLAGIARRHPEMTAGQRMNELKRILRMAERRLRSSYSSSAMIRTTGNGSRAG